jgi:hypothetical protein
VGEVLTSLRTRLVDRTECPIQKHTTFIGPSQDQTFLGGFDGIRPNDVGDFHAQVPGQTLHVALIQLSGCDPAAIRASFAVDPIFNLLRDCFEPSLDKVMAFQPCAKS